MSQIGKVKPVHQLYCCSQHPLKTTCPQALSSARADTACAGRPHKLQCPHWLDGGCKDLLLSCQLSPCQIMLIMIMLIIHDHDQIMRLGA